jgi:hypothetical protein
MHAEITDISAKSNLINHQATSGHSKTLLDTFRHSCPLLETLAHS